MSTPATPIDRSSAVNLARNMLEIWRCHGITPEGVRSLCDAVIAMDGAEHQRQLLADTLGKVLVAAGVVRADHEGFTGPQLLQFGEELADAMSAVGGIVVTTDPTKQALWLAVEHTVVRYLLSCSHGRWNGGEKALRHEELCRFYVATYRGTSLDRARRDGLNNLYREVHDHTQKLTDHLDEAIGFPLDSQVDMDAMAPKFFDRFHELALEVLQPAKPASAPPAPAPAPAPKVDCHAEGRKCDEVTQLGRPGWICRRCGFDMPF